MIFRRLLIVITLIAALPFPALFGAEEATVASAVTAGDAHGAEAHGDGHKAEHHGLPKPAPVLFYGIGGDAESGKVGPLAITNSMVVMLIVAAGIILVVQLATRKAKMIPSGLQNFVEWLVESLYDFFEGVLGAHMVKKTFWFFATIFIFILFSNWAGLLPGLGTIGWAESGASQRTYFEPTVARRERRLEHDSGHGRYFHGAVDVLVPQGNWPGRCRRAYFCRQGTRLRLFRDLPRRGFHLRRSH